MSEIQLAEQTTELKEKNDQPVESKKKREKRTFTTKSLAGMAIFTALSYGVSFLEFSIFPSSPVFFLKMDFSNVFIMLAGFMYGPIAVVFVGIIKELLCLIGSTSFGIGQIANFIVILAFVLPPSIIYNKKKGIKVVILSLILACVLQIIFAMLANKFITFPLYGMDVVFDQCFWLILAFNAIKSVTISVITILLYKRISYVFEKMKIR